MLKQRLPALAAIYDIFERYHAGKIVGKSRPALPLLTDPGLICLKGHGFDIDNIQQMLARSQF